MTTLYKIDNLGNTREWNIDVEHKGDHSVITVSSGIKGGKMTSQITEVKEGKNIGKANQTNHFTQALADMDSEINSKLKEGYVGDIEDFKGVGIKESGAPQVMLAKTYDPNKKQSGSKDLKGYDLIGKRVAIQRKFDGTRRLAHYRYGLVKMYTRSGDISTTLPHIEKQIAEMCKFHGIDEIWFDGEAYSHEISFNKVNGITRKGAKTPEDRANTLLIKYFIYDTISPECYTERYKVIQKMKHDHLVPVETEFIIAETELLKEKFGEYVDQGYEGLMIRRLGEGYEHKRSKHLLKYKAFEDAEFVCINVEPTKESGTPKAGKMWVHFPGEPDKKFKATVVGTDEECVDILQNQDDFIGKNVTVNYFGVSEYGIPRFPRVKGLRHGQ